MKQIHQIPFKNNILKTLNYRWFEGCFRPWNPIKSHSILFQTRLMETVSMPQSAKSLSPRTSKSCTLLPRGTLKPRHSKGWGDRAKEPWWRDWKVGKITRIFTLLYGSYNYNSYYNYNNPIILLSWFMVATTIVFIGFFRSNKHNSGPPPFMVVFSWAWKLGKSSRWWIFNQAMF